MHSVTSDMGSMNQAMWRAFSNIGAHRHSVIHNSVPHPMDSNRKLFFFADGPHLIKNLRTAIIKNKLIVLPEKFAKSHQLSSYIVKCSHLEELINEQENLDIKLAPKLKKDTLQLTQFNKMKVQKATNMFSKDVSSSLQFLSEERNINEYSTTAKFIEIISKWFSLITSRHMVLALGRNPENEKSIEKYTKTVQFLESCIDLFCDMQVGKKDIFKPVQTGLMISTKSYIEITEYLIKEHGFLYVQGARFSNDFVENFFSNVRKKFPVPNVLQFKYSLKCFTVSQYLQELPNTNYDTDTGTLLAEIIKRPKKINMNKQCEMPAIHLDPEIESPQLDNVQLNSLYYVCGYIISSICKNQKLCDNCLDSAGSKIYNPKMQYSRLVSLKCYRQKTLFFVNDSTFQYFLDMYIIINRYLPYIKNVNCDILQFFVEKLKNVECKSLKNCHDLANKIKIRFIKFKVKTSCRLGRLEKPIFNSKTMAMHSVVK